MFTSTIGTPLDARNVVRHFKRTLAAVGLPDMRRHDLRHTCATPLLVQRVPSWVVTEVLGHSQISLTRRCSHVVPESRREAPDLMERVVVAGD